VSLALNRANSVYLSIFAVFVIGIWAILDLGSALLTAPRDLSGKWRLMNASPSAETPASFSIAQSGRFLRFTIDGGPRFDVILAKSGDGDLQHLKFEGQNWNVTGTGSSASDKLDFKFQPPANSKLSPMSGTYQRLRMGPDGSPLPSPTSQPGQSVPQNAVH